LPWRLRPKRVAIIGGGYIGVELAGVSAGTFGTEVTIVALEDRVLALFDPMISETLAENMGMHGIEMHLEFEVVALEKDAEGLALVARDGERLAASTRSSGPSDARRIHAS
jgi:pyruvate/2-oxoglutarate dehydrogenase complex dihydrolipoamide dehydrogenase (E3) component